MRNGKSPAEAGHDLWLTFHASVLLAHPDGGIVVDTRTKQIAARIPTSEKLIEIDFEGGRAVRAGHR